jgi:putative membrane protein
MMGMYTEVLGAVNDRDFVSLGAFIVGAILGLALFSTLLSWLLEHYRAWVIAAMIGLMIGSIRVLWPWPNGTNTTRLSAPSGNVVLPIVLAVVGIIVVVAVDIFSRKYVDVDPID